MQGHVLEQACEPGRGPGPRALRPGLCLHGAAGAQAPLRRYDFFEELEEGESIFTEIPIPVRTWRALDCGADPAFLAATEADPLSLLFRIVLLCGTRRGEAVRLRWSDVDLDNGVVEVRHTLVMIGGAVVKGTPKTKAGRRIYGLDTKTVGALKEHRKAQLKLRLKAGKGR